jgi:hypothetical protein
LSLASVGSGWVRASITFTNPSGVCRFYVANAQSNGGATTYAGNGTNGLYVWGAQLNIGSTAKPYFPTTDRLNVPRLTYQNGGGGCPSLLLEPQRTNLFTYSEQFDNADWSKTNATITANSTTSPDGTQNADSVIPTTTNGVHRIEQDKATASQVFTQSIFAKANGYNFIAVENGGEIAYFNISTGVVGTVSAGTASIQNMGNGWYRCVFTATAVNSKSYFYVANADNSISFAGDATSGIFVWGCQFESGSYATSYISTTSASATRVADECSKTGISSLIGQTEGVIFLDFVASAQNADGVGFSLITAFGDSAENFQLYAIGTALYWYAWKTGVLIDQTATQTLVAGDRYKVAYAYKSGDWALYINGVQKRTNTAAAVPVTSQFNLSASGLGASTVTVKNEYNQAVLFKTRLTNAELASITSL